MVVVSGLASGSRVLFPNTRVYVMDMLYFNNVGRLASNKSSTQVIHATMKCHSIHVSRTYSI